MSVRSLVMLAASILLWAAPAAAQASTFLRAIGSPGSAPRQFLNPSGVAVSPAGDVFVTDYSNLRVQVFTSAGVFLRSCTTLVLPGNPSYSGPYGIAVDAAERVSVSDYTNGTIKMDSSQGDLLRHWGGLGALNTPTGLAIDQAGEGLVCDQYGNRVVVYSSDGTYLRESRPFRPRTSTARADVHHR